MSDGSASRRSPVRIGLDWLIEEFDLKVRPPAIRSEAFGRFRRTIHEEQRTIERYPREVLPKGVLANLRFALRNEPIALDVYLALFQRLERRILEDWLRAHPISAFARRAWYLYEVLLQEQLAVDDTINTGYVDLLSSDLHIVGPRRPVRRQRIYDNLLGSAWYSPLVRRSHRLQSFIELDLARTARSISTNCAPAILARGVNSLWRRCGGSGFSHEEPQQQELEQFIAVIEKFAGLNVTSKEGLIYLHNAFVPPEHGRQDWRTAKAVLLKQPKRRAKPVCIPPPPKDVAALMTAWMELVERMEQAPDVDGVVVAGVISIGFLLIRPFEDANSRIYTFLAHYGLSSSQFTPAGKLCCVSPAILRRSHAHERFLNSFSAAVKLSVDCPRYSVDGRRVQDELSQLYRYFDATVLVEDLYSSIRELMLQELPTEMGSFTTSMPAFLESLSIRV